MFVNLSIIRILTRNGPKYELVQCRKQNTLFQQKKKTCGKKEAKGGQLEKPWESEAKITFLPHKTTFRSLKIQYPFNLIILKSIQYLFSLISKTMHYPFI
jgi:hypothetical protein